MFFAKLSKNQWLALTLLFLAFSFGGFAHAEEIKAPFAVLDRINDAYKAYQMPWYNAIKVYAVRLFWMLALVDFSWSAIVWAMEKNDIGEVLMALMRKIFSLGFFWSLLKMSDTWIPAIISSLSQIGQNVGGVTATPDGLVAAGFLYALGAYDILGKTDLIETLALALPVGFLAMVTFFSFLWVAKELLTTLIESYLQIGAGVILLGFGGSRWTTDFATKYIQSAFGTGLKLMMLYLIVGIGSTIHNGLKVEASGIISSMFVIAGASFFYACLATKIPQLASAMMSGSPSLSAGGMMGAAIGMGAAIAGAATGGAALAAGAAGAATTGAAGASGLAQALSAGMQSAGDLGKTGGGAAMHAAGEVAKHGLGLGVSNIGSALSNGSAAFREKVANSTGGQIASSIESGRGGSLSGAASAPSSDAAADSQPASAAPEQSSGNETSASTAASAGESPSGQSNSSSSPAANSATSSSGAASTTSAPSASSSSQASGGGSSPTAGGSSPGSSVAGSTSKPAAASAPAPSGGSGSASSTPSTTASTTPQPDSASSSNTTPATGDASNASIGGGENGGNGGNIGANQFERKFHEKLKDLESYVPQDGASSAAININMGHAKD